MIIKGLIDEDFVNYKEPSMFIAFPKCTFKCEKESGVRCCQNSELTKSPNIEIDTKVLVKRYLENPLTTAITCGGLEPFDSMPDLLELIYAFRSKTKDTIIIYTGYNPDEIAPELNQLKEFSNIIVKFGRFLPNGKKIKDNTLGVILSSENQFAKKIS